MADENFKYLQQEGDNSFQLHNPDVDEQGPTPTHIVFFIHGMGYKMFEKDNFRQNMLALSKSVCSTLFTEFQDSGLHLYFYPIEWAEDLHGMDTVDERLKKITLPSVPGLRVLNNDCLADVLFYFTEYHRQKLFNKLGEKINDAFTSLASKFPDYNGTTGVIGHSLGGVIGYDLLVQPSPPESNEEKLYEKAFPTIERPTLKFKPSFLFTLGCPVAAVIVMRGLEYEHYKLPESILFKNIFNPYDPLAYRIEPIVNPEYEKYEPVPLEICPEPELEFVQAIRSIFPPNPPNFPEGSFMESAKNFFNLNTTTDKKTETSTKLSEEPESEISPSDNTNEEKPSISLEEAVEQIKKEIPIAKADFINPLNTSTAILERLALENNLNNEESVNESKDEQSNTGSTGKLPESSPSNSNSNGESKQNQKSNSSKPSTKNSKNNAFANSPIGQWVESARQLLTTKAEDDQLSWVFGGLTLGLGAYSTKSNMEHNSSSDEQKKDEVTQAFNQSNNPESSDSIKLPKETKESKGPAPDNLTRFDYALQIQSSQNLRIEYLLGVKAHFCYWYEKDIGYFLLNNFKQLKK